MPLAEDTLCIEKLSATLRRGQHLTQALRDVNLRIAGGEIVAVVGESGSGKSTLGLAIQGLISPDAKPMITGSIRLQGQEMLGLAPRPLREHRRRIGVVFQDPVTSLNPSMTISRQIVEAAAEKPQDPTAFAVGWLNAVGVARARERLRALPHQLSGGQNQRVMLAMALAARPALVIADEPTTALDMTVQAQILRLIATLRRRDGISVLFVTHDLGVAAAIADRVVVLQAGRIVESGKVKEVLERPVHPYTRALVASRLTLATDRSKPLATSAITTRTPENIVDERANAPSIAALDGPVLEFAAVCKTYARRRTIFSGHQPPFRALDGIDLKIADREAVAIVGESGSGKSTLLRIAAGIVEPDSGGRVIARGGRPKMVFQDAAASLTPWLTVGEQVGEAVRHRPSGERRERVARAFADVGLAASLIDAKPRQLSGGQAQRAAIARAIIVPPTLLMCDEPISAIDVSLAAVILNLIHVLRRRFGMALLFVTHDLAAARYVADRIVVMRGGRIVEDGPAETVVTAPRHEHTRELLDALPERIIAS